MGLLTRKLGIQALSVEDPAQPLLPPSALFESLGLGRSDAGVLINERQAMRITTAYACVKIISEDLASTSHEIFQHMPDGTMRPAPEHRLWQILHDQPNPQMTAMTFWSVLLACALGWGPGYAWIKRDRAARVISLVPLHPGKTSPMKIGGQLIYGTTQTDTGEVAHIAPDNVLHIVGVSWDGITSMSPVQECKNAFGLAAGAEKFGAQFFGNGARATGVFTHPEALEPEAYENLKKSLREIATGENALRPLILEEGMTWQQLTIAPNDAQFLATRQFQRAEIASLYRVPLHLLQDLQRATNNNIEHQSLDYVRSALHPWAVRIEQEVNRKLLGLNSGFTMEHNLYDLQRGDFASQTTGIQTLRNIGLLSTNDGLKALRMNPIAAEDGGDIRTVQGAMISLTALLPATEANEPAPPDVPAGSEAQFDRMAPAFRHMFRDAVGRVIKRGGDPAFARDAFHPIVSSMMQGFLGIRFGTSTLTPKDRVAIAALAAQLAAEVPEWTRPKAAEIATWLTEKTYRAFIEDGLV